MNLNQLTAWINAQPTTVRLDRPRQGHKGTTVNVLMAKGSGKRLAFILDLGRIDFTGVYAQEIIATGDIVTVRVDEPDMEHTATFERVKGADARASWDGSRDALDDVEDINGEGAIIAQLDTALERVSTTFDAPKTDYSFVRVSDAFNSLAPAGVLVQDMDGSINQFAFTGYEGAMPHWIAAPVTDLDDAPRYANRNEVVSAPEKVRATDYGAAVMRAMMRVAEDHYQETGKAVYVA